VNFVIISSIPVPSFIYSVFLNLIFVHFPLFIYSSAKAGSVINKVCSFVYSEAESCHCCECVP